MKLRLFLLTLLSIAILATSGLTTGARAESGVEILKRAATSLQSVLSNPARLIYLRELMYLQLEYRFINKPRGYEDRENFQKGARGQLSKVMYDEIDKAGIIASTTSIADNTMTALAKAFESQQADYDKFTSSLIETAGAKVDASGFKSDLLDAMALYAVANATLEPNYETAGWFSESYVWPFCFGPSQ